MNHRTKMTLILLGCIAAVVLTGTWAMNRATDGSLFTVTAYCPCEACCGRFSDGITASGHIIMPGDKFVASPPEIAFGTMLDIPGYGIVPVLDRGPKKGWLDVFYSDHETALDWGVQKLKVKIRRTNTPQNNPARYSLVQPKATGTTPCRHIQLPKRLILPNQQAEVLQAFRDVFANPARLHIGVTARELSRLANMDYYKIQRRVKELEYDKIADTGYIFRLPFLRDNMIVWSLK